MKNFSFFVLFIHFLLPLSLYSKPSESAITRLQIPVIFIGDPGNKACFYSGRSIGAVAKNFLISKYEITAANYCAFLNAVATQEDPHQLYKKEMTEDPKIAGISRTTLTKEDGSTYFHYEPLENKDVLPITYVSLRDAERFCNWLENNAPTNDDDPLFLTACTEKGAYFFSGEKIGVMEEVIFNLNAHYYIPSEDEWFKAAYYKSNGTNAGYWAYPTCHDSAPNNGQGEKKNQANYKTIATGWESREKNPAITPVDYFHETYSAYGVYDMGGNVAEWTSSLQEQYPLSNQGEKYIVRGGSWQSEYSIWWNNELMAQSTSPAYDPLTANNFIGFRIAAIVLEEQQKENNESLTSTMTHCSDSSTTTNSFIFWTVAKGILFGCPRTMVEKIFQYFGYDAATLLGVTSLEEMSLQVIAPIVLIDLAGYIAVMGGIALLSDLIPWASLEKYVSSRLTGLPKDPITTSTTQMPHDHSPTIKDTVTQSIWSFLRSLIGCGMCLLTTFLSALQLIAARLGIGTAFLKRIEDFFVDLQLADEAYIPEWLTAYIPTWLIYRLVPVGLELGFLGLFLFGCYEFLYYWPALKDNLEQLWYAYINCSTTPSLDMPGVIY